MPDLRYSVQIMEDFESGHNLSLRKNHLEIGKVDWFWARILNFKIVCIMSDENLFELYDVNWQTRIDIWTNWCQICKFTTDFFCLTPQIRFTFWTAVWKVSELKKKKKERRILSVLILTQKFLVKSWSRIKLFNLKFKKWQFVLVLHHCQF